MELGITLDEFRWLTPRLFYAMWERRCNLDKRDDLRFGVIASVLCAVNGKDNPPGSFFGHKLSKAQLKAQKLLEAEQLMQSILSYEAQRQRKKK